MNILAIDTGTETLTVCLSVSRGYYENRRAIGLRHAEQLMPLINALLTEASIKPEELDLIVCASGPGSFTGLRIGMATAKGLALGAGADVVSVPTLDTYGHSMEHFDGTVIPVIDAKKNRYYCAGYEKGERVTEYLDISKDAVLSYASGCERSVITGPNAGHFQGAGSDTAQISVDSSRSRSPGPSLISLGISLFEKNGPDRLDAGPAYLRRSEAEIGIKRKSNYE